MHSKDKDKNSFQSMIVRWIGFGKQILTKTPGFLFVLVTIFSVIDYFLKWEITSYLFTLSYLVLEIFKEIIFEIFILAWLILLTIFFRKLRRGLLVPPVIGTQESQFLELENSVKKQETITDSLSVEKEKIKTDFKNLHSRLLTAERTIIDFEIENYKKKNQIGAMSCMLKKLKMDKQRGYGTEDTLFEIKEYIKERGMPNIYLADLNSSVSACPSDLILLKEEVFRFAKEKLYKIGD